MPQYFRSFEDRVREAIEDELRDASFYNQMATIAPNDEIRAIIMSIAGDEYGHARIFSGILDIQTGMFVPPVAEELEYNREQFIQDLRRGIDGELQAVSEYALLARDAPNDEIRAIIMSVMGDEYAHARIFLSILSMMQGADSMWGGGLG
ncbi:MAG TPA: ferritin-like domain-containing protein [Clostridia bacterium]|nr:ferritin-like domain-containing protein [Clostridia bacterium]